MGSSRDAPHPTLAMLLMESCAQESGCLLWLWKMSIVIGSDWSFPLTPFPLFSNGEKTQLDNAPNFKAMQDMTHPCCTNNGQISQKITLNYKWFLFFCFYYTKKYQERNPTKLVWGKKRIRYVFHHIMLLPLVNLLTVLTRFCIELIHAFFHLSGNWTLKVKGDGTGEIGNNWLQVLQELLKGMSVSLGSWPKFSHIHQ